MELTTEDVAKITAALTKQPLEPSEWALFYLVMGDLGMSSEKLKEIKELKSSGEKTDSEAVSSLLQNLLEQRDKTASVEDLIAAMSSNIDKFPGLAKQDYVTILNQIKMDSEFRKDSVLSPMENAFECIELIRGKIFKHLSITDKRCLRLTSKSIWRSTLSDWRKSVALRIGSESISMAEFYKIYLKQEGGNGGYELGNLIDHPFTSFTLFQETISPFPEMWKESEQHFWGKCAPHITHLYLSDCSYYEFCCLPTYVWLVTKACSKIESLRIVQSEDDTNCKFHPMHEEYLKEFEDRAEIGLEFEVKETSDPFNYRQIFKNRKEKKPTFNEAPQATADKLKILDLRSYFDSHEFGQDNNMFLNVAPNLDSLTIDNPKYLNGLQTALCKLSNICIFVYVDSRYRALQTYTNTHPIKNMRMREINLMDWSSNEPSGPSPIFQSIQESCFVLVTLDLELSAYHRFRDEYKIWINHFSTMSFPSLKKLVLRFQHKYGQICFDFATLRNAPNLTTLVIKYDRDLVKKYLGIFKRASDWVQDVDLLEENPLRLDKLVDFCFDGWLVDEQDLTFFRSWFPSLKHLKLGLDNDTSPYQVLTVIPDLKSITLTSQSETHQDELIIAKVLHEKVRIFMECSKLGKVEAIKCNERTFNVKFQPVEVNECLDTTLEVQRRLSFNRKF